MNKILVSMCVLIGLLETMSNGLEEDLNPYINMSMVEMIHYYNYSITDFNVTTKDGYILQMFRLQNKTAYNSKLYPVMMIHGLGGCADNWFLLGRQSLVLLLANLGYDIWMTNARGTFYGRKHIELDPKSSRFWSFTWHQIGVYDIPAFMDTALEVTGHKKLSLIGHSEGGTDFFVMASKLPEYDRKVAIAILMAPGVFFRYTRVRFWRRIAGLYPFLDRLADFLQLNSATPRYFRELLPAICNRHNILSPICYTGIPAGFEDPDQLQPEIFQFMVSKVPCGGSFREGLHYLQNMFTGGFNHYDFGPRENLLKYNSTKAPPYLLENIKTKIVIFYALNDYFVSENDIKVLVSKLSNVVHVEAPSNPNWSHMDFLVAKDVNKEIYSRIIMSLRRINRKRKIAPNTGKRKL